MNNAIIIQQVYVNSEYTELAALTFSRNLAYAKAHKFDYDFSYGDIMPEWEWGKGGWAKLALIISALERNYQYVVWLDADSLIVDLSADLRDGCPDGIGMVVHRSPNPHFNVGNIYITNSEKSQRFIADWISWYPGPAGWHEQAVANLLAQVPAYAGVVKQIDNKWNSCRAGNSHVDNAVVEGFHGEGTADNRLRLMNAYMEGLK